MKERLNKENLIATGAMVWAGALLGQEALARIAAGDYFSGATMGVIGLRFVQLSFSEQTLSMRQTKSRK